jgi:allophanate hydrolase
MRAEADARALAWHASTPLAEGTMLDLRPLRAGYSYLHVAGGIATEPVLDSRSAHLSVGIGAALEAGDRLPCAPADRPARRLSRPPDRFEGGLLRLVETPQTRLFPDAVRARFERTRFARDPRGDRRGVRLACEGVGFEAEGQLALLSDFVLPGDVQMTGDGTPYILGPECQTTGGYPRIGSVIPADLPRALQAPPGAPLTFRFVPIAEARAARCAPPATEPLVRAPADDPELMTRQLIGGVVSARGEGR